MNNKWVNVWKALKDLLNILSCSKCKQKLHDPQQFLKCGHFSCVSCINNNNTTCIQCHFGGKSKRIEVDDRIQNILQACCTIAQEIGFQQDNDNNKTRSEEVIEQLENHTNVTSTTSKTHSSSKKKQRKRKILINKKFNGKKIKTESSSNFRIPKNIEKKNHYGETKLHQECKIKGHEENVKRLLDAKANPNVCCNNGWTPLQESAAKGHYEVVKLLLEAGADANLVGHDGKTALHSAVEKAEKAAEEVEKAQMAETAEKAKNHYVISKQIIILLLKYNAKKDLIDKNGDRPINYCKSEEIQKLLYFKNESGSECGSTNIGRINYIHETVNNNFYNGSFEKRKFNDSDENENEIQIVYDAKALKKSKETTLNSFSQENTDVVNYNVKVNVHNIPNNVSHENIEEINNYPVIDRSQENDKTINSQESIDVVNFTEVDIDNHSNNVFHKGNKVKNEKHNFIDTIQQNNLYTHSAKYKTSNDGTCHGAIQKKLLQNSSFNCFTQSSEEFIDIVN